MYILLLILILITGILGAYTSRFQETTLELGRKIAPNNKLLPTGMQDAITPRSQSIRSLLWVILLVLVFVLSIFLTRWYFALLITLVTFWVITPICKFLVPRSASPHYLKLIKNDLIRRNEQYKQQNDRTRIEATDFVLQRMNTIPSK